MRALVTLTIGTEYQQRFDRYCRKNWTKYAERHGYDLIVIDKSLDDSARARARPIYWQKNLILQHEAVSKYRQVAWIDSDFVINAGTAPPIFAGIADKQVGAVDEYSSPDPVTYRRSLAVTYLRLRRLGQPFLHNLTAPEFYRNRGLPEFDKVVQGGLLVCSPRHHREVLQCVYAHEDMDGTNSNKEMGALSYELLRRNLVTWMDPRFNRLVLLGLAEQLPRERVQSRSPAEAGAVRPIIAELLAKCYFLHFAGCQDLMCHLPDEPLT